MDQNPGLTIVLLGKTGVGKSATGNTILGQAVFESKRSFKSVTTTISKKTETVFGKQISVIDTPGILGSEPKIETLCQDVLRSSRPYLFLVVVKIDRFTDEDQRAVEAAITLLGDKGLEKSYLLFTGKDNLDMSLSEFINEEDEGPLIKLIKLFNNKYHAFNNKNGGQEQVQKLLEKSGNHRQVTDGLVKRKIVLLGLSGSGKSSSGNTILGSDQFKPDCDFESVTAKYDFKSAAVEGRWVTVIDTPGFTDTYLSNETLGCEILKAVKENGQEIHAFVIVVEIGRISEADCAFLEHLPPLFGSEASKYTMVLFTHGDKLNGQNIDDKIQSSRRMTKLVTMCCGRYSVFDNTQRRNRPQVRKFLDQIDEMLAFNGRSHYTIHKLNMVTGVRFKPWNLSRLDQEDQAETDSEGYWETLLKYLMMFIEWIQNLFHREHSGLTQPLLASQ